MSLKRFRFGVPLSFLVMVSLGLLWGCGGPPGSPPSPAVDPFSSNGGGLADAGAEAAAAIDVDGDWLICDAVAQGDPGSAYYIAYGGAVLRLTTSAGVVSGVKVDTSGNPAGLLLRGPLDPSTRVWTADLYSDHWDADGGYHASYPAAVELTISVDATRCDGRGMNDGRVDAWWGGRQDGSFTCNAH